MKRISLIIILILGTILRVFSLATQPSGLNADEAALAYNAYSLLQTGRDEHNHAWPINFESFGDFKPALYGYVLMPFIKIFGLNALAVRLPSAIFGITAIGLIYLLTVQIFDKKSLGLISALFLAISPWAIHFSRGGWEVNMATTLLLAGTASFLTWTKRGNFKYLLLSILCLTLSMYTYQSTRVIAPLFGLGLLIFYYKDALKLRKQFAVAIIATIIVLLPLGISLVKSDAGSRFSGVGFTSDEGPLNRVKEQRGHYQNPNNILSRILHNRPVAYTLQFFDNYLKHFSGDFLFVNGDVIQRNKVPETGLFYLTDIIFVVFGAAFLIRRPTANTKIVWLWIFLAPLASALTFQTPHALRAENLVIPMTILIAAGFYWIVTMLFSYKKKLMYLFLIVYMSVYAWQISRYLHEYYVHYPKTYPAAWEYGFEELVNYVASTGSKYDSIIVTDKYDQPYILFLFYLKYPPQQFQNNHELTIRDKFNFSTVKNFDKYEFTNTAWENVRDRHSSLIAAAPEDIPEVGVNVIKTIYFPNGNPAFKIISN